MSINIDDRTEKYFEEMKSSVGYLDGRGGRDGIEEILNQKGLLEESKLEKVMTYQGYGNSSDVDIYKYINTEGEVRYCAEFSYQTAIDDYCVEKHIFSKFPSSDTVLAVRQMNDVTFEMKFRKLPATFRCWECGKVTHWLDCPGTLSEKKTMLEDKYCGSC